MKYIKQISISLGLIAILAFAVNLFSFSKEKESDSPKESSKTSEATSNEGDDEPKDRRSHIRDHYKIFSVPLPEELSFAGERVPLQDIDVRERLDREFIVNTYWHSQTFLFQKRANRWFPIIDSILAANDVPQDFKYLALIESGLDNVVSPAGASGFWQFMRATGRSYGLEVNKYVDERYQVEKATAAACKYLKNAYKQFGNWTAAAASYNMGMGGLSNRLKEQQTDNYYDLYLNSETSRYVFRILAAKHILENPKDFGFNLIDSDLYPTHETKVLEVDSTINNLSDFAISQGTNYKILKKLNPWLRDKMLPNSSKKTYRILVPAQSYNLKPISQY